MPKYAVAVGRKVGVFDTYPECQSQVKGYPNAKFRKFDTQEEAEEFVKTYSAPKPAASEPIKVERVSPSDTTLHSLNSRICRIEAKLDTFMTSVQSTLDRLEKRITAGEVKRKVDVADSDEPPAKLLKPIDSHEFIVNENGSVVVYTDGACSNNGKQGAKAGVGVWFGDDHPLNISAPVKGPPTNNTAEIQAARLAIDTAVHHGVSKLCIHTDSQFLISCITQWIHRWKKNNWKTSEGGPVKNKSELVKLDAALQTAELVTWSHVPGHSGIKGNTMADLLARKGAEQYDATVVYSDNSC